MARKPGKLPGETMKVSYSLEYGSDALEIPAYAVKKGTRILLVDDLLATGGTIRALEKLFTEAGAEVVGTITAIELTDLKGREVLHSPYESLIKYPH